MDINLTSDSAITILIILTIFWMFTLCYFMDKSDDFFKGKYDKILWFIVIFFGYVIGALTFFMWNMTNDIKKTIKQEEEKQQKTDLSEEIKENVFDFCYHCGKEIEGSLNQCPHCKEKI